MKKKKLVSGNEVEKLAKKWLKEKYPDALIEGPPVRTKWCRQDYFSLFDFLLVFPDGNMMGVQVTKEYFSQKYAKSRGDKGKLWQEWPGSKLFLHYKNGKWELK